MPYITFHVSDARGIDFSAPSELEINTFVKVDVVLRGAPCSGALESMALDLTTYTPREKVVHFRMYNKLSAGVETYTQFPNLRALSFDDIYLPTAFPDPNLIGEGKMSPSLEHIFLERMDDKTLSSEYVVRRMCSPQNFSPRFSSECTLLIRLHLGRHTIRDLHQCNFATACVW